MLITETWLRKNNGKPREKILEKADRDGLSVRASLLGKLVFQMRYRIGESTNPQRLDLGVYPQLKLTEARAENLRLKGLLDKGHDPKVVRALEKRSIESAPKFEALFRSWYDVYCSKKKVGHHEILRSFELYVFPEIGALPGAELALQHWLEILDVQAEERPAICARILTNGKQMLKWCVKRELLATNVLIDIFAKEDFDIEKADDDARAFTEVELCYFWKAINLSRMVLKNKIFLVLCLFFGCRNGELRLAKKVDFDFDRMIWTVPPQNHKMGYKIGKPILRPIISEVVPLLRLFFSLSGESAHAFTSANTNRPMKREAALSMPYNIRQWLRRHEKYEMEHWSVHDLRKTARTHWSALTELAHVCELMLGHVLPRPWRTYDGHKYLDDMAVIYRSWWCKMLEVFSTVEFSPPRRTRSVYGGSVLSLSSPTQLLLPPIRGSGSHGSACTGEGRGSADASSIERQCGAGIGTDERDRLWTNT